MRVSKSSWIALVALLLVSLSACKPGANEEYYEQHVTFPEGADLVTKVDMASRLVPSERQLQWQQLELTAFMHFGINTFEDVEWGSGAADPALFNPTLLDTDQWVRELKDAGFKMVILTAKHHDGFCLWQTETTDYSVRSAPWKEGNGDVVKELAASCRKYGLKLGIYLSPWDRNHPTYGTGDGYNEVYLEQLRELLSNYGKVDEVWFDGANGEGPNGKRQEYDWDRVLELIRELQPDAVTAIMGVDARWVGNERGYGRETEWSATVLPPSSLPESREITERLGIEATSMDLGSRDLLAQATDLYWYPSEVDVSIRPGWFYHASQDKEVKSLQQLADIYFSSVGMNSSLLLNIPPNREGRFAEADVQRLREFGAFVRQFNDHNLVKGANSAELEVGESLEVTLDGSRYFSSVLLQENIARGQRVERFSVEALIDGEWHEVAEGTTIGYKRILLLDRPIKAESLRVTIEQARGKAHLSSVGAHLVPDIAPSVAPELQSLLSRDLVEVRLEEPLTLYTEEIGRVAGFVYTPSQEGTADTLPLTFEWSTSADGEEWQVVMVGEFSNIINNPIPQVRVMDERANLEQWLRLRGYAQSGEEVHLAGDEVQLIEKDK